MARQRPVSGSTPAPGVFGCAPASDKDILKRPAAGFSSNCSGGLRPPTSGHL